MPVLELAKAAPGGSAPSDLATPCPPGGILCRRLALPGHRCVPLPTECTAHTLVTSKDALEATFHVGIFVFFPLGLIWVSGDALGVHSAMRKVGLEWTSELKMAFLTQWQG